MKTYTLVLESMSAYASTWARYQPAEPQEFGQFRTNSLDALNGALEAAAGGAVAIASDHNYVVAYLKGRRVAYASIFPR